MEYRFYQQPRFWYAASSLWILLGIVIMLVYSNEPLVLIVGGVGLALCGANLFLWFDIARMRREIERLRDE